ncbi:MAG: tRNA-dihydrouridine synthase family protein [Muribaculaceae bacterium]|nr:tRNA-dihydrouridine synthase family protein [Muribaculaceae bacterium]
MNIHFAPVQGHTDAPYRRIHAECYRPADTYYTPFIRLERGAPRSRDMRDILPEANTGLHLVPQVIFRDADELLPLVEALSEAGAREIDINMGCPFPLQTARGRGAALAGNADAARLVRRVTEGNPEISFSVKMRLGMSDPDEWRRVLPILNDASLHHVTLHPRVARQQYGGEVDMERFGEFYSMSENPVVYNGDLLTPEDVARLAGEFPDLEGIMIGRGLLGRPSLTDEIAEGSPWEHGRRVKAMLGFHRRLLNHYEDILCGDAQLISKIQPFWEYAEEEIGRKPWKAIKKAGNMAKYHSAVAMISPSGD